MDDYSGCYLDKIPFPPRDCFERADDFDSMAIEVTNHNFFVDLYNARVKMIELEISKMQNNLESVMDSWRSIIKKFPKDIREKYKTQIKETTNGC